ncbi:hypothetical protein Droror1_Dr00023760 [Drosera rotundifolia]
MVWRQDDEEEEAEGSVVVVVRRWFAEGLRWWFVVVKCGCSVGSEDAVKEGRRGFVLIPSLYFSPPIQSTSSFLGPFFQQRSSEVLLKGIAIGNPRLGNNSLGLSPLLPLKPDLVDVLFLDLLHLLGVIAPQQIQFGLRLSRVSRRLPLKSTRLSATATTFTKVWSRFISGMVMVDRKTCSDTT